MFCLYMVLVTQWVKNPVVSTGPGPKDACDETPCVIAFGAGTCLFFIFLEKIYPVHKNLRFRFCGVGFPVPFPTRPKTLDSESCAKSDSRYTRPHLYLGSRATE